MFACVECNCKYCAENTLVNTLHGGRNGWDYRNFTVVSVTNTSITFSLFDPSGTMGFPGDVLSYITYTLSPYTWHIKMTAFSLTQKTPIMLTSHTYWNLDGFQNPDTETINNHTLHLPFSGMIIGIDGILIPTGELIPAPNGTINDFWSAPKAIGRDIDAAVENCGAGCTGYDNAWIVAPHALDKVLFY
jgi:aldose 1-epimerase